MIGHLQSNKAAKAAEIFQAVDSIDSAKLAQRLNESAQKLGKTLDVLIEINVGGEEAKSGLAPDSPEIEDILSQAPRWRNLHIRGLMTVPPFTDDPEGARPYFRKLREMRDRLARPQSRRRQPSTCSPWACRTTSKSPSKRARPACASAPQFSECDLIPVRTMRFEGARPQPCRSMHNKCRALAPEGIRILSPALHQVDSYDDPRPRHTSGSDFQVKVHPRARKNAITGTVGDALKLSLTAPPIEGRANEACIAFLAKFLNVPRSSVTIAAGESSRQKVIRIAGLRAAQAEEKLRLCWADTIDVSPGRTELFEFSDL